MIQADWEQYDQLLADKISQLAELFREVDTPEIEIFPSPPLHFRMRAEFRIWHQGDRSHYAMTPAGERKPAPISSFAIGSRAMVEAMPPLLAAIEASEILRRKLYAVEFLTTRSSEVLATLIYHKRLDDHWRETAQTIGNQLGIHLIGRSRKQKVVIDKDFVIESFEVAGKTLNYQQVETGFTQPNAAVNEKMLNWAVETTLDSQGDLLELYCGNGNFTLALAANFDKVLATEVAKLSVNSAKYNIELNKITNVEVARMSSEEFTSALHRLRPFRRLRHIDLDDYRFATLFVDPPRAGLDAQTLELAKNFERILYISCNPNTLRENLDELAKTHEIKRFAAFDQFPYSRHLEVGILLEKPPLSCSN